MNDYLYRIKIKDITNVSGGFCFITPEDNQEIEDIITVTESFYNQYSPKSGGYLLMYREGVCKYSES